MVLKKILAFIILCFSAISFLLFKFIDIPPKQLKDLPLLVPLLNKSIVKCSVDYDILNHKVEKLFQCQKTKANLKSPELLIYSNNEKSIFLPILKVAGRGNKTNKVMIWSIGGPLKNVSHYINSKFSANIISISPDNMDIYFPLYNGVSNRIQKQNNDVNQSIKEVYNLSRYIKNNSSKKLIVAGESLGGYIAIRASKNIDNVRVLSISPPLTSINILQNNFRNNTPDLKKKVNSKVVFYESIDNYKITYKGEWCNVFENFSGWSDAVSITKFY